MILLKLFLSFLKIGAVSFGGGYGMISLMRETALGFGVSEEQFLNFVAVSESTPGPIAVNMATFIGSSQGGVLGALVATVGVVLPAFIIMLLISALLGNFLRYKAVSAALDTVRPCVVGLILATALTMFLTVVFSFSSVGNGLSFDWRALLIFALAAAASILWKHFRRKQLSPIFLILLSGCAGMLLYSI